MHARSRRLASRRRGARFRVADEMKTSGRLCGWLLLWYFSRLSLLQMLCLKLGKILRSNYANKDAPAAFGATKECQTFK